MPLRARHLLGALAALLLAVTLLPVLPAGAAPEAPEAPATSAKESARAVGLKKRIARLGLVTRVRERSAPEGFRYFLIDVRQPVDHTRPRGRTFTQRLSLLHRGTARPTVLFTSGYGLYDQPFRAEPTQLVDGNQLSMEHRFFTPSRPDRPQWRRQLTIEQAAADQHRVIRAFRKVYDRRWLSTGGSKGGMTATYHRRFYPRDVDGTVPYVAPNDVVDDSDVYDEFLGSVGTPACRDALIAVQRRVLGEDRAWFADRMRSRAREEGLTFEVLGGLQRALEVTTIDFYFAFWQYAGIGACGEVPSAGAPRGDVLAFLDGVIGLVAYSDQASRPYVPYYYQAATQLGAPTPWEEPVADLLRHPGSNLAADFVPRRLHPLRFDAAAMPDVDRWVRTRAARMLYLDGGADPWSAEPFDCGSTGEQRDCHRFVVEAGTHGSSIADLPVAERARAEALVRRWAGVADEGLSVAGTRVPALDDDWQRSYLPRRP